MSKDFQEMVGLGILILLVCAGIGGCNYLFDKGSAEKLGKNKACDCQTK